MEEWNLFHLMYLICFLEEWKDLIKIIEEVKMEELEFNLQMEMEVLLCLLQVVDSILLVGLVVFKEVQMMKMMMMIFLIKFAPRNRHQNNNNHHHHNNQQRNNKNGRRKREMTEQERRIKKAMEQFQY